MRKVYFPISSSSSPLLFDDQILGKHSNLTFPSTIKQEIFRPINWKFSTPGFLEEGSGDAPRACSAALAVFAGRKLEVF